MSSRTIYILMAQSKNAYTSESPKVLQAFTDEDEATKMKLLIEDCGPKYEIVVAPVTLVDTGVKPVALKPHQPGVFWPSNQILVGDPPPPSANNLAEFAQKLHDDAEA